MFNSKIKEFFDRVLLGKFIEINCIDVQPERLNPEDHIEEDLEMICDSPNTTNK